MKLPKLLDNVFEKILDCYIFLYVLSIIFFAMGILSSAIEQIATVVSEKRWVSLSLGKFLNDIFKGFTGKYGSRINLNIDYSTMPYKYNAFLALCIMLFILFVDGAIIFNFLFKILRGKESSTEENVLKNPKIKTITIGFLSAWLVGILAILLGSYGVWQGNISFIYVFLIAFVVLPPFNEFYQHELRVRLSGPLKLILVIALCVLLYVANKNLFILT